MPVKLSEWAEKQGITYQTAWKWFQAGKAPVKAEQTPTGTIIVYVESR
jgi:predicted site-specific integrase-resolvase